MSDKVSLTNPLPPTASPQDAVPTELIPLPSDGKVYPEGSPLHQAPGVMIRSMTAHDEDILTSRALIKAGKAITTLLKSCLIDKSVDVGKLLAGDRNAVLIGIRITGYGAEYKVSVDCPECSVRHEIEADLSSLPIKRMPEGITPRIPFTNEFEFKLPISKKVVTFKLMTGDDESEMLKSIEATRKAGIPEELVTTRLRTQIVSMDGETDKGKLALMIRAMPARDSRDLRKHIDTITPGVQLTMPFTCPGCGYEAKEVEVPMGTDFFWPAS
jgi:hypothetical protein